MGALQSDVYRLSLALGAADSLPAAAEVLLDHLGQSLKVSLLALFLAEPDKEQLTLIAGSGFRLPVERTLPVGQDPWAWLALHLPELPPEAERLAIPLMAEGQLVGVACLLLCGTAAQQKHQRRRAQELLAVATPWLRNLQRLQAVEAEVARRTAELRASEQALRRRTAYLEALNAIIASVASASSDLDTILERVLDHTLQALRLKIGAIWLLPESGDVSHTVLRGLPLETIEAARRAAAELGMELVDTIAVADWRKADVPLAPLVLRFGVCASITVPLLIEARRVGGLGVAAPQPREWSADEVALVESVGRETGGAIERVRLLEKERRRSRQLALVAQVARRAVAQLDPDALLWETAQAIHELFGYPDVLIALVNHAQRMLIRKAWAGVHPRKGPAEQRRPIGERGILDWVAVHGETVLANNVREDPRYVAFLPDTAAELCVPIKDGDTVIGLINVESDRPYAFDEADVAAMEVLADELAIALRNVQLFADKQQKIVELAALIRVGAALVASLELDELLEVIHQQVTSIMPADAFFIALYDAEADELDYRIRVDEDIREPPQRRKPGGLTGQILRTGQPILIREWQREKERYPQPKVWGTMKLPDSWLGVPMKVDKRVVGVMSVQAYRPHVYDEGHLDLLSTIANMAAVAVERARLHEVIRQRARRFEQLSQRLMALQEAGRAVSQLMEPREVLRAVRESVTRILPEVYGVLFALVDEEAQELRPVVLDPQHAALQRFAALTGIDLEQVRVPLSRLEKDTDWPKLTAGEPVVSDDLATALGMALPPALLAKAQAALGIRSIVFQPLRVHERIYGVMLVLAQRPVTEDEMRLLEALGGQAAVALENARLYGQLEEAYIEAILALAKAMDARDAYTADHSARLAEWAVATAKKLGCTAEEIEAVRWAALLHDIGKIGVPDRILQKPGPLTDEEWAMMKRHPEIGAEIVAPVKKLARVAPIIRAHHERWDGKGYPQGLKGEEIPLPARILAVVDAYGAMIDDRVYRKGREHREVVEELRRCAGTQFDPQVVEAFLQVLGEVQRVPS